jgi:Mg-chelatase subunit ChlD
MKANLKPAKAPAAEKSDKAEGKKNLNFLLFCLTFLAGCLWWLVGESILIGAGKNGADFILRNPLFNGLYFAFLALFTLLACFISENLVHSIVGEDFFNWAVNTPSLKKILLAVFTVVFLTTGILEFLYELEPVKRQPKQKAASAATSAQAVKSEVIDYYFLLDNSSSMIKNDPNGERIKLLKNTIDRFSDNRNIALVTFNEEPSVALMPVPADQKAKTKFKNMLDSLYPAGRTNIKGTLGTLASIIDIPASHRGIVIFISDGDDTINEGFNQFSPDFKKALNPYVQKNIPINTIFLNPQNYDSVFLKEISNITGGVYSTANNPLQLETEVTETIKAAETNGAGAGAGSSTHQSITSDPLRDVLANRTGKRQNSVLYALFHLVIITIIGFLLGYSLFTLFSHRAVKKPLIIGGGISGLLAGLVLEFGLQSPTLPPALVRMFACVILSTVIWSLSFIVEGIGRILEYRKKGGLRILFSSDEEFNRWSGSDSLKSSGEKQPEGGVLEGKTEQKKEAAKGVLK